MLETRGKGVVGDCCLKKFVIIPSGDSSKDVRERGDPMLLRIAQPLAITPCLERALSVIVITMFRQPDFQPQ